MSNAPRAFQPPRPNFGLMWALGFVNRWSLLLGLPFARTLPLIRDLPFVRGYFRLRSIELPSEDRARLASAVSRKTAAFIGPNHPEFGFDWMMDKEISTYVAPRMASWASHGIVATAPGFWLRNNLISHNGGEAATDFSVRWALMGNGVLLHPEGSVHWTGDTVHPLFQGIADMACAAAQRGTRPVFIVPIVWKLRYIDDVSGALHREMALIERHLGLADRADLAVAERFHSLQEAILKRQMVAYDFDADTVAGLDHFARQDAFRNQLLRELESRYPIDPTDHADRRIARLQRVMSAQRRELRGDESSAASERAAAIAKDLDRAEEANRLGGFIREAYATPTLTQEQIAESLKRHRAALVTGGVRNTVHNFLPTPYGPRVAHVRVPEPIRVDPDRSSGVPNERAAYAQSLLELARQRMQQALDEINSRIAPLVGPLSHTNPFAPPRRSRS